MNNPLVYGSIMFVAGLGIPVGAALNGGLGGRLQNPSLAAVILFSAGLLIAVANLLVTQGMPKLPDTGSIPWYFFAGGFFVMFYVLTITWVAPRFGVANAVAFVLLGQLVAMSCIDHFGLFGSLQTALSKQRLCGLLLMTIGIFLVLSRGVGKG